MIWGSSVIWVFFFPSGISEAAAGTHVNKIKIFVYMSLQFCIYWTR